MITDPISDMLIRIKNASRVGHQTVTVPFSELKFAIAELLLREGYLTSVVKRGKKVRKTLALGIAYKDAGASALTDVTRISKPSRRVYLHAKDIYPVRQGKGLLVISTPSGLMTGSEAYKNKVGGEALFSIW